MQTDDQWGALESECGVLHFEGGYGNDYSYDDLRNVTGGQTYADHVANYTPPVGSRIIASTATSRNSHYPHPSAWHLPGTSPALFETELQKAVDNAANHSMLPVVTVYNIGEWAEGGPGLQPNMKDRFGYLQAVKNIATKPFQMKTDDDAAAAGTAGTLLPYDLSGQ